MRYWFFIFVLVALSACATPRQAPITASTHTGLDPNENREEASATGSEMVLIGPTTRVAFEQEPYSTWFHPMYLRYKPNETIMEQLQPLLQDVTIKAFMGSWCIDSQREIPRFYKILDAAHIPHSRMELVSLRENKTGFQGEEKVYDIVNVPTFIFFREGKEVGRIVETAYPTLEMNMVTLLTDSTKAN